MAALAAKWREPPRDALDTLVLGSADVAALEQHQQVDYQPFDPTTKRTEGTIRWGGGPARLAGLLPGWLVGWRPLGRRAGHWGLCCAWCCAGTAQLGTGGWLPDRA